MTAATTSFEQPRMDLAHVAPLLYRALGALGNDVELEPRLRELVNLRASILNGCAYCIDMHTKVARRAGESEQRLHALAAWHEAPFFDDKERAALALTDAVTLIADQHVPREVWEEARAHFPAEELAQLVWAITVINAWNRIAITTRMAPRFHETSSHARFGAAAGADGSTGSARRHALR
jgi:AhpD family alkylhydroperoxidase